MTEIAESIAGTVNDLFGDQTEDPTPTSVETAQDAEVETEETPAWTLPSIRSDLFDDDEDEEPEFSLDADDDEQPEDITVGEYDDEDTIKLKTQVAKLQKQAEFYQRQHLKSSRKAWEADVRGQEWGQFLPPDLSAIKADSHRDFKRKARSLAKSNYETLRPHYEKLEEAKAQLKEQALKEAREEARKAWGKPLAAGGGDVPAAADPNASSQLDKARRSRNMFHVTKAYLDNDLL